jgi:hypothetical protein
MAWRGDARAETELPDASRNSKSTLLRPSICDAYDLWRENLDAEWAIIEPPV